MARRRERDEGARYARAVQGRVDRYELHALLGEGGHGAVYRARHALFHWPLGAALALFLLGHLTAALGVVHAHWRERRATANGAPA